MTQGKQFVLLGAGTIGRVVARQLLASGNPPLCFADNSPAKHDTTMEGIQVCAPSVANLLYPGATWIATAMQPKFREELLRQIAEMGVKSASLWEFMPKRHALPPRLVHSTIAGLLDDEESYFEWCDQCEFRENPSTHKQRPMSDINEIYFPDFFTRHNDEHFLDLGACEGDTVAAFIARWKSWHHITAVEPDRRNYNKLCQSYRMESQKEGRIDLFHMAVSDCGGKATFVGTGDMSAHLGAGEEEVRLWRVDYLPYSTEQRPTFIKADIEGSELEMLWGARHTIAKHSPVLAICAYHAADHLWQIPLLLHAIQPEYKLFLRRYAEGTWELIYYAVPPERLK